MRASFWRLLLVLVLPVELGEIPVLFLKFPYLLGPVFNLLPEQLNLHGMFSALVSKALLVLFTDVSTLEIVCHEDRLKLCNCLRIEKGSFIKFK